MALFQIGFWVNHCSLFADGLSPHRTYLRRLNARHDAIVEAARAPGVEAAWRRSRSRRSRSAPGSRRHGLSLLPRQDRVGRRLVEALPSRYRGAARAADAAPGPLSALAAAVATFGARALADWRLTLAVIAEPVDTDIDAVRQQYRRELPADSSAHPRGDRRRPSAGPGRRLAASALVGALIEGLIGPLAPAVIGDPARARERCRRSRCSRCAGSAWSMPAPAAWWCRRFAGRR